MYVLSHTFQSPSAYKGGSLHRLANIGWPWRWALTRELLLGFLTHLRFYQPGALAGSTIIFVLFVCLLVDCAMSGEAWEQINGVTADMCGWLEFVGPPTCSWFVHLIMAKSSQTIPVLSTAEAQLPLHKHNIAKGPQKHGNGKKPAANYEPAEVRKCNGVTVLCVLYASSMIK